jgi:hypothetical protein
MAMQISTLNCMISIAWRFRVSDESHFVHASIHDVHKMDEFCLSGLLPAYDAVVWWTIPRVVAITISTTATNDSLQL